MKEKFEKPEMEKIAFEAEDVIVTSECGMVCAAYCYLLASNSPLD